VANRGDVFQTVEGEYFVQVTDNTPCSCGGLYAMIGDELPDRPEDNPDAWGVVHTDPWCTLFRDLDCLEYLEAQRQIRESKKNPS